ncbi:MAG: hypothetical protein NC205_09330 [Prevotella sp.]|nr:hypothetical protein [Alistipes senegalensis]MCM1358785.1 hypothetical protein [Prevotella sp.]MCM1474228.1 hypothetical protein [Muribaculaceae bacterium]
MNENMEQVQETETIQETAPEIIIDYKAEFEKSSETIKKLQTELAMERHHVIPEHRELISATLVKLADESTSEEKAFELMQKMYPEAFKPKVPEFSVSTTGVSGIRDKDKSGFLAGFTGNKPL